jgi:hypothetical protein
MAEPKTRPTDASVEEFLQPEMWGASIVGFGRHTKRVGSPWTGRRSGAAGARRTRRCTS